MATWRLPQHEVPGRALLSEALLYGRRERVFLVLAAVFVGASLTLPLLGLDRVYGANFVVRALGYEPEWPLLVPLGMFAFPLALLALNMVAVLWGAGRARVLALAATVIWVGALGLAYATDHLPAFDTTTTDRFPGALALVAFAVVTCFVQVELVTRMRRIIRSIVPLVVAVAAGGGVAALIVSLDPGTVIGGGGYLVACVLVGSLLLAPITRALMTYLRFGRSVETIVEDEPAGHDPAFVGRPRSPDAWNSAEMAFFDAGERQAAELQ